MIALQANKNGIEKTISPVLSGRDQKPINPYKTNDCVSKKMPAGFNGLPAFR
jgi:hypothetical protein